MLAPSQGRQPEKRRDFASGRAQRPAADRGRAHGGQLPCCGTSPAATAPNGTGHRRTHTYRHQTIVPVLLIADTMAHPFTQLSQDEQRDQLGCADAWPLLSLSYNPANKKLLIAARHHAGRVDVFDIDLNASVLSASVMLWWWSLTRQLLPTEQSYLEEHLPGSWLSFRSALELLIDWAAGATETQRHDLVRAAAQHCTLFGDAPVCAMDFRTLLETLALVRQVKPVILRVPLLHWLSRWAAEHVGSTLRCPQI